MAKEINMREIMEDPEEEEDHRVHQIVASVVLLPFHLARRQCQEEDEHGKPHGEIKLSMRSFQVMDI